MADLLPSRLYHPRALVVLTVILDDQVVVSPGAPITFQAVPRSVDIKRNSARKCDEATIELDYGDFPLDPRTLRAVHVAVHIEDALDVSLPMFASRLNLRFVGNVDEPEMMLGPDRETVRLTCRDYTAIYLGRDWRHVALPLPVPGRALPAKVIATPPGVNLYAIVEAIRAMVTPDTLPTGIFDEAPTIAIPYLATGRQTWAPAEKDANAWDVLCGLCDLHGLVPSWDLDVLSIRSASAAGFGTAFMIYGQNVSKLTFKRALQSTPERKPVEVIAWNPALGQSFTSGPQPPTALAPPLTTETGVPKPSATRVVQYHVEGAYTVPDLISLALGIYQESARGKLAGELETADMSDALLIPLLGLKNGDRISIRLAPDIASNIAGMSAAEAFAFLANPMRGAAMNPAAAAALVQAWTVANTLSVTFYVTEAHHKWDRDGGYRLTIRFSDFVLGV